MIAATNAQPAISQKLPTSLITSLCGRILLPGKTGVCQWCLLWLTADVAKVILGAVVQTFCNGQTEKSKGSCFWGNSRSASVFGKLIAAFGVLWALIGGHAAANDQRFVTLMTGGVTGVYFPAGNAICRTINRTRSEHGLRCAAETGRGSIGNLEDLRSQKTDFAIVQADWLHHAYSGTSVFEGKDPFTDLRTVLGLHLELATVVVRDTSGIGALDDLKGLRVNIGPSGSGSAATWTQIAKLAGWTEEAQRHFVRQDLSGLGEALCTGTIDAYFVFIGHPAGVIEDTLEQCGIRFLGMDDAITSAMLEDNAFYQNADLPAGTYEGQGPVATFGTPALVMTTKSMPEAIVERVAQSVIEGFDDFRSAHPALEQLNKAELANPNTIAPLHHGALHFYRDRGYLN